MGCIASAVAAREKNKVQPTPSPKVLRGDLLSRNEARQRRNKSISDHHTKANKLAQTIAYNTMAEKEMMSTASTEKSYRSGRAFFISATAGSLADNNASEQGSSSTISEGANPLRPEQQGGLPRNRNEAISGGPTRLPFAVPEEESLSHGRQDSADVKVRGTEGTDLERTPNGIAGGSVERPRKRSNETGKDPHLPERTNLSNGDLRVKGHEAELDSDITHMGEDHDSKRPAKVQFEEDGTGQEVVSEVSEEADSENVDERTKPTDKQNGSVASVQPDRRRHLADTISL